MERLAGHRITLTPRPVERRVAALEAALLGHCPGLPRLDRLLPLTAALEDMRSAGFGSAVANFEALARSLASLDSLDEARRVRADVLTLAAGLDDAARLGLPRPSESLSVISPELEDALAASGLSTVVTAWKQLRGAWPAIVSAGLASAIRGALQNPFASLYHLPIALRASAEFHDIFPDAASTATRYTSRLAGNLAWLAEAVDDFFANGGEKLWVVRIPEQDGADAFMPATDTALHDPDTLRGLASVLAIPTVAVVGLPDLERLQIPAQLRELAPAEPRLPEPQFLPCAQAPRDEEQAAPAATAAPVPRTLAALLLDDHSNARRGLLPLLARHRPDVQCLLTLPLASSDRTGQTDLDPAALADVTAIRDGGGGHILRHAQFLFPYLRGPRYPLRSPTGLIAGQQCAVARRLGPWRSTAARPLATDGLPYPPLSLARLIALREEPGIGLLHHRSGITALDDERLVVPALPPADYAASQDRSRFDGFRAAELMRFLGYLRRQLQSLGEQLVFDVDIRDPRPRIALDRFLRRLHTLGALRGALPEDAFQVTASQPQEGALLFEIMIAPALPIDRLRLTFANLDGEWRTEVTNG